LKSRARSQFFVMASRAPKIAVADEASIQTLIEKYGVETLIHRANNLSLSDKKKTYGYGYTRVSDPRTDPQSLGLQEEILRKYAEEIGVTIIHVYSDYGMSGGLPAEKRKGLLALLWELQPGFKVIASRADRLFRNRDEKKTVKLWLAGKNATMMAPDYKDDDEFNKSAGLPNIIIDEVNEHYRYVTAEKVKLGLRQKSADGTLRTKPYYGWKFDGKGKPWVEVEYEQRALRKIEELKLSNPKMTNGMIVEGLVKAKFPYARETYNKDGTLKRQSKWSYQTIQNILIRLGLVVPLSLEKPCKSTGIKSTVSPFIVLPSITESHTSIGIDVTPDPNSPEAPSRTPNPNLNYATPPHITRGFISASPYPV
jgi:DNA invertase Pin-like site-specific DNA recombinase